MNEERLTKMFLALSGILALVVVGINLWDRPVVLTPSGKEYGDFSVVSEADLSAAEGESGASASVDIPQRIDSQSTAAKVNVNTATKEELISLNGIGEVLAQRIIEERQLLPFEDADDLRRVKGIGEKTVEKLRGSVVF